MLDFLFGRNNCWTFINPADNCDVTSVRGMEESDKSLYDSREDNSLFEFKPHSLHLAIYLYSNSSINRHVPSYELPELRLYLNSASKLGINYPNKKARKNATYTA